MKYSVPFFMGDRLQGLDVPQPHRVIAPDLAPGSEMERIAAAVPADRPLYVHVDTDVADLAATGNVVAFSLTTWNPALEGADIAAAASHQIASPFLG